MFITTDLEFYLPILNFYLKALVNHLFFFKIFSVVFKKSSRFSIELFFKMRFGLISYCCLALDIFLVFSIGLKGMKDKEVPRYIQNPEKNMMESCIMLSNTLYFFIQRWPKIIGCCSNLVINRGN